MSERVLPRPDGAGGPRPLTPHPRLSAVLPVRDAATSIEATVKAVLAQQPPVDEVVLAVGPSTDDTWAVARRLERDHDPVKVVANERGEIPDGLNAAIAAASGDVLVRVDARALLPAGYVARALDVLHRTGAANVGGRQVPDAQRGFARAVAAAMRSPLGAGGAAYRRGGEPGPADTVYLGVFRRDALREVGGFDPAFRRNEDAELNQRLRSAGHLVWLEPDLAVAYGPRDSLSGLARQYFDYGRWRRLTARRHPGSLRARQLAAPVLVAGLGGALAHGAVRRDPVLSSALGGGYALTLLLGAAVSAERLRDAPAVAVALATMHLSWGTGFLVGPPRGGRT